MECEYCNQILKTVSSLKQHQKTAKYCLSKQDKKLSNDHICVACGKKFTRKSSLDDHVQICKENTLEKEIIRQYERREKEIIGQYEKKLAEKDIVIKQFQDDQRKQINDLTDRIQSMAEKAIERPWETVVEIEQETENIEEISNEPYELFPLELDNGYIIESREEDGYINITNLFKAGGKEFKHWNSLSKTKAFLKALSTAVGIPTAILIQLGTGSKFGTTEETTGTWVHPQVAINIAQWISPQFDVKVSAWVKEEIT